MDYRLYPTFIIAEHKGIIPNIPVPEDYKERISEFYKKKGKEKIEDYVTGLEKYMKSFGVVDIRLNWDLPWFQEHNLGGLNGFMAACIATKYVSELLKISEK